MADYLAFSDLYGNVEKYIKAPGGAKLDIVKDAINMVYLNELIVADQFYPMFWMLDFDDSRASVAPATITAITKADPGVFTTDAAHGLVVGDIVGIYNIGGMTEFNNRILKVNSAPTTTTLSLIDLEGKDAIDTSSYTTYTSGGTIHHRGLTLGTTPTGFEVQRIIKAAWHDEDIMLPIDIDELENLQSWLNDSTARPDRYFHKKAYSGAGAELNLLIWFQGAEDAYDLRYWYERRAARLSADADVPLLPPQFHNAIISGACARLAEYKVQVENAVIWPNIYLNEMKALVEINRKWWKEQEKNKDRKPYLL